jgi:di/tricarboxylate transporter
VNKSDSDEIELDEDSTEQDEIKFKVDEDILRSRESLKLMKAFVSSIAFSSCIGDSATLTGNSVNLLVKKYLDDQHSNSGLNYGSFIVFSLPQAIIKLVSAWIIIIFIWLPKK